MPSCATSRRSPRVPKPHSGQNSLEGLRYLSATPVLRGLLRLEIVFSLFSVNPVIITIIATEVLGVGPEGLGGLLGADALGALIGVGTLLTLGQPRRQGRFSILSTFAYAAALVAFALSQNYVLSFVALVACGVTDVFTAVTRMTIMQLSAPAQMRGRVMANMRIITGGIGPLAETQSGVLASLLGGPLALITAAGLGRCRWMDGTRRTPRSGNRTVIATEVTELPASPACGDGAVLTRCRDIGAFADRGAGSGFRLKGNFAPLGYRNYALYWIGLATTRFGKAIEDLGAVWLVYVLTDSAALLGLLGLARAIPAIAVGPFAGVVADRFDQRRMLFVTPGLGLVASLALGLLIASGRVEVWHVYLQVAVQSAINSFDGRPARHSSRGSFRACTCRRR